MTGSDNHLSFRTQLLHRSQDESARKGPRTTERIRWAACELLEVTSLDALTIVDICRKSEIAQGTLYQYFESRNALLANILQDFVAFLRERMYASIGDASSDEPSVVASMRTYCLIFTANRGLMKCLLNHFDTFGQARSILNAFNTEWLGLVVRQMARQRGSGGPSEGELQRRAYALGGMVDQYLSAIFLYEDAGVVAAAGSLDDVVSTLTFIWTSAFADIAPAAESTSAAG